MVRNPPPGPDGARAPDRRPRLLDHQPSAGVGGVGHVGGFNDPMQTCRQCKKLFRADHVWEGSSESEWVQALRTEFPA